MKYKPNKFVYEKACDYLGLKNDEVMLVAAHENDLLAAEKSGLKTGFVYRPFEHSDKPKKRLINNFDYNVNSFIELYNQIK